MIAALVLLATMLGADSPIVIASAEVGTVGAFPQTINQKNPKRFYNFHVVEILDDSSMVVQAEEYGWKAAITRYESKDIIGPAEPRKVATSFIIVKGVAAKGLVGGKAIGLPGRFIMTGTEKREIDGKKKTVAVFEATRETP